MEPSQLARVPARLKEKSPSSPEQTNQFANDDDQSPQIIENPQTGSPTDPQFLQESLRVELPSNFTQLESQTCYRLGIKNSSLVGACLRFSSDLAVFPFSDVGKRPILKEEYPKEITSEAEASQLVDVELKIFAGDEEIRICDDYKKCAKWREKTTKPLLVLTPRGQKMIQFGENMEPFLLLIFRCCPRFHHGQDFELHMNLRTATTVYTATIDLKRKRNQTQKKKEESTGGKLDKSMDNPENCPSSPKRIDSFVIRKLQPKSAPAAGGVALKIEGSSITLGTQVVFNGRKLVTYLREDDEKELVCFVPPGMPNTTVELYLIDENNRVTPTVQFKYRDQSQIVSTAESLQIKLREMETRMAKLFSMPKMDLSLLRMYRENIITWLLSGSSCSGMLLVKTSSIFFQTELSY